MVAVMLKNILKSLVIMACLMMLPNAASANSNFAEEAQGHHGVEKVDHKKRIIYLQLFQIGYDSNTRVTDRYGNPQDIKAIIPGDSVITFKYDVSKRFLNRPVATMIVLY